MNNYFDNNVRFNTNNNRPLINREQNYFLERKLLTVHSEDRDIRKWPKSNNFAIRLPDSIRNVDSMRLVECELPINYYTFSNYNQNTKLSFSLIPKDPSDNYYTILNDNSMNDYTITIQEGYYSLKEIAIELENKMNDTITQYIIDNSGGLTVSNYTNMKVYYDKVAQKYWFGNLKDCFVLKFNKQEHYDINCDNTITFYQYTNWGLPNNIGFDKKIYNSISSSDTIKFSYLVNGNWLVPTSSTQPVYYVKAPHIHNIACYNTIYMEVNKYNTYDELRPYTDSSNNNRLFFNDFNGRVNSAFAKIPIVNIPNGVLFDSRNGFLVNVKTFLPPEERISVLEFKFRYHDGRLVDFCNCNFNFTIEFNILRDEINRNYNVRVPDLYSL